MFGEEQNNPQYQRWEKPKSSIPNFGKDKF